MFIFCKSRVTVFYIVTNIPTDYAADLLILTANRIVESFAETRGIFRGYYPSSDKKHPIQTVSVQAYSLHS